MQWDPQYDTQCTVQCNAQCDAQCDAQSDDVVYEEVRAVSSNDDIQLRDNDCYECVKKPSSDASSKAKNFSNAQTAKKTVVVSLIFAILVLLLGVTTSIALYTLAEITSFKSEVNQKTVQLEASIQQLESFSYYTAGVVATIDARNFFLVSFYSRYATPFCDALPLSFPAGYYYLLSSTGSAVRQYCPSITTRCGRTGRWHSVANLDMTNSTHQCFGNLTQDIYSNKRLCVRSSNSSGCSSVQLPTITSYRSVCGLVKAYQFGSSDAFLPHLSLSPSIDDIYVDGVSITHGSPRQHIWTFAATSTEQGSRSRTGCPCAGGTNDRPTFVGNDYFCDTGTSTGTGPVFYGNDPLWDGAGCGPTNNCCSFNTPPWFYKELPQYTYDDIELRICSDFFRDEEDVGIENVQIFVK